MRSKLTVQIVSTAVAFIVSGAAAFSQDQHKEAVNYAAKVNTLIGMEGKGAGPHERYLEAGYTFPGAMYPFGMVQFTPTFFNPEKGFVVNQMSGAGCEHMGNFPTLPLAGPLHTSPNDMMHLNPQYRVKQAMAGFYHVKLGSNGVDCQLSVTPRTGMALYTYPAGEGKATIVIGSGVNATKLKNASIKITAPNRCEGVADGGSFCGYISDFKVYFVAEFDARATSSGTWKDQAVQQASTSAEGPNSGAYFTFDVSKDKSIRYKFAISYVSLENAKENLRKENPSWNFDAVKNGAIRKWNQYLSRVAVSGGTEDHTIQFYTHLYHSFAHPDVFNDVNGQYLGADNKVHKTTGGNYYTAFSNWDTYRTQIQLISMLAPEETSAMMNSIITFAQQSGGGFPRWVMANTETGIMQGDPTSILVANAYAFGATNFDKTVALKVMRQGAEVPGTKSQLIETRPYLQQYLEKGYMNASMQLEYASADFAIGQFAKQAFNNKELYKKYLGQSQSWKNLYNPATTWLNSRNPDGSWKKYDQDWREASYKNYFWMVPHNLGGLINKMGGKAAAEARLDSFFSKLNASYNQEWFAAGNEPDFQTPWIYNWTNGPYKTSEVIRRIIREQYSNRPNGMPGNDDLGAMGAFYVFANIGLFPEIPGVAGFSLNSPSFPGIKIQLGKGSVIITGGSETKTYIQSLQLDGKAYDNTWLPWEKIRNGAKLNFVVTESPNKNWGLSTPPPSFD